MDNIIRIYTILIMGLLIGRECLRAKLSLKNRFGFLTIPYETQGRVGSNF